MVIDTLYHPPQIHVDIDKTKDGILYLDHKFEGKPLKPDYIENTMAGIEFLWGGPIHLATDVPGAVTSSDSAYTNFWDPAAATGGTMPPPREIQWKRMRYVMENRKLLKREL